jgi:uncharacterized protein
VITAVCDTNVYISSLISSSGPPDEVLALGRAKKISIAISQPIVNEIKEVLEQKLLIGKDVVNGVIEEISRFTFMVEPGKTVHVIKINEADNRIIECAVEAKARFIISGDKKHLLPLKKFEGIRIVSPVEFLKAMNSNMM